MTKILLTRHGHVDGIKPERFRGRQPLGLTAQGRADAAAVARRIAASWQPESYLHKPDGALREDRRSHRGRLPASLPSTDATISTTSTTVPGSSNPSPMPRPRTAALFAAWFATPQLVRFPNGESLQDLAARTANAVRLVLSRHPDDIVVVVGHDSVNRALLLQFLDLPLSAYWRIAQNPCCLNEIDVADGKVCVQRINETYYLEDISA